MAPLIELTGVSKRYRGSQVPALDTVDLAIEAGRVTAIMGPSGCGKSTLLNLIAALDRPSAGTLRVADVAVERLDEGAAARYRRARVGLVFQFFNLLEDLTVRDNVAVPARLAGASADDARTRADALLAGLGLERHAARYPATLSGGERQRVAIARAMVNRPAILLADEPTGALDTINGASVLGLFDELNRGGQTIVVVTHDAGLAERIAHRIVHLVDGRIVDDARTARAA
jgi:putative ABC transport system ATP-binding protein